MHNVYKKDATQT